MSDSNHHGMHSFEGKNVLCSHHSFEEESFGRFGRMFRELSPLYNPPSTLSGLGKKDGPMNGGNSPKFTNSVPLGMVFFGQFIDHDITFDTSTSFSSINNPNEIENSRSANLDLDSVFGGGPEDDPFLYKPREEGYYLLTALSNNNIGQNQATEKNDLQRNGKETAIIGDPRNDENRVISQMQLAFVRFYNANYKIMKDANPGYSPEHLYEEARKTTTWHYQWIVVNEFLPMMCGKYLVADILGNGRKFYKPVYSAFIPVEFSVAAFRFGHTMIAQKLKLQQDGEMKSIFSKEFGKGFSRLTSSDQAIEWNAFFDYGTDFQKAEKLDTTLAPILLELPFVPSDDPNDKSLATRNFRRGQSFLLPSGENVARHMQREDSEIEQVVDFVNNKEKMVDVDLSAGIPLWYYVLAEAEVIGRQDSDTQFSSGEGLGPVGGRIVAEVLLGLLELDRESFLGNNRDWVPTHGKKRVFTMKDLLEEADKAYDL
ncbi:Animal haem peroxidase [Salegentibacter salinarum]|nr:heme peroxidase family protein [Salegentibacter salinarum]SKB78657.1 Animal haem peroxidase [Salegentibacter salinarum]